MDKEIILQTLAIRQGYVLSKFRNFLREYKLVARSEAMPVLNSVLEEFDNEVLRVFGLQGYDSDKPKS